MFSKEDLIKSVAVDGAEYPINYDFGYMIAIEEIFNDDEICEEDKLRLALELFYKETIPLNVAAALEKLIDFYKITGRKEKTGKSRSGKSLPRIYDFEVDKWLIYSAFRSEYGINLFTDKLHWFEFFGMFDSLPENHKISQIMKIRAMDLSQIKDSKTRLEYALIKEAFSLEKELSKEQKEQNFANMF